MITSMFSIWRKPYSCAEGNWNRSYTYNLGNGKGFSVQEVIETARKVTGHPIPAKVGSRREGDPDILIADSQKIKDELGWQPKYDTLDGIISSAWAWHRANPNGFTS